MPHCREPEVAKFVATKIRTLRKQRRFSQEELGRSCGISFQQVQKIESGTNRVSADALWLLAQKLEVPVWFFFPTTDAPVPELLSDVMKNELRTLCAVARRIEGVL